MKLIWLTQGQIALIDDEDYDWLNQWKWYAQNTKSGFYAVRREGKNGKCILMHRLILGLEDRNKEGEHSDRNTLNNQRYNLREATHSQNMSNKVSAKNSSSKYLGVHWCKRDKRWKATIAKNNKRYSLGSFKNEVDAALAYNERAFVLHGEFTNLNELPCGN